MTSTSKNAYINKLDNIENEYNTMECIQWNN